LNGKRVNGRIRGRGASDADAGEQPISEITQYAYITLLRLPIFDDAKLNPNYDVRNNKIKRRFRQEAP
jgi:hypothetical protein